MEHLKNMKQQKKTFKLKDLKSLIEIRHKSYFYDEIIIYTKYLKYLGLLPHSFKYAIWALKEKGKLVFHDDGPINVTIKNYQINFYQVVQAFRIYLSQDTEDVNVDYKNKTISCVKIKKNNKYLKVERKWSFGIIFSGNESENSQLLCCIKSINDQGLKRDQFEIVICGPSDTNYDFISEVVDNTRILYFDDVYDEDGRFLISRKKNYLINNLQNDNCIILHSRILFDKNQLEKIPVSFDFLTPRVLLSTNHSMEQYIDYKIGTSYDPTRIVSGITPNFHYKRESYLFHLRWGYAFGDGGIMIFRKSVLNEVPLNEKLGWFENEDLQLCSELHSAGFLIDYIPEVITFSRTNKRIVNPNSDYNRLIKPHIPNLLLDLRLKFLEIIRYLKYKYIIFFKG